MKEVQPAPSLRTAMILAAGYGTRMGDLTRDLPKPLLPLNGIRIIEVVIGKLARQGIKRIVINAHYQADRMRRFVEQYHLEGVELMLSEEPELLGSGGGIGKAEPFFRGETILAANADVLCRIDLSALYEWHCRQRAVATLAVLPSLNVTDYSLVLYDQRQRLKGFHPKKEPLPAGARSGIFTGFQILTPRARDYLAPRNMSIIDALYQKALADGEKVMVYPYSGGWLDIGTAEFYRQIVERLRRGEIKLQEYL